MSILTTRVQNPDEDDKTKLTRLINYLHHTQHLNLRLSPDEEFTVTVYVDAAHGVHVDGKGHTGAVLSLGRGGLINKSSKQNAVTKSSTESEVKAVSDFLSQVIWMREFMTELGYKVKPAIVHQDNMSTIKMIENGRPTSEKTRHFNIRFFFIKDRIDAKEVEVRYCPTDDLVADTLTKILQGFKFLKHRANILGQGAINHRCVLEINGE